jgi:hypothetical protein
MVKQLIFGHPGGKALSIGFTKLRMISGLVALGRRYLLESEHYGIMYRISSVV